MRGGFTFPWIGLEIELLTHSLGITQSRADWLVNWISDVASRGTVRVRDLGAVLGRLSFAAGPLERLRPFLACAYAWVAVVPDSAFLEPPPAVLLCLKWIAKKLKEGGILSKCEVPGEHAGEVFRSDAKAEGDDVVIGGWECRASLPRTAHGYIAGENHTAL